jgi:uncharacterized zinc-type alcohol dehydrogenase-like protein
VGLEQYCTGSGMVGTYNAVGRDGLPTQGGYSGSIVVDENYVLHVPDSLPLDAAAPLLCAGITTYSPLRHWNVGPGSRVGVVGMGGLGHMAVKLAAAMGAEVTVLSQSLKKMEDGLRLGAKNYYATSDTDTFKKLRNSFDIILNTVSADLPLGLYLDTLDLDGVFVELGAPENPLVVPSFSIIGMRRSISGSMIGGIPETQEMLDFCAEHTIASEVEVIEPDYINEAYEPPSVTPASRSAPGVALGSRSAPDPGFTPKAGRTPPAATRPPRAWQPPAGRSPGRPRDG